MGTKKNPEWAGQVRHPRLLDLKDQRHCGFCGHDLWNVKAVDGTGKLCPGCGTLWQTF